MAAQVAEVLGIHCDKRLHRYYQAGCDEPRPSVNADYDSHNSMFPKIFYQLDEGATVHITYV
jgi:hypothetical protein